MDEQLCDTGGHDWATVEFNVSRGTGPSTRQVFAGQARIFLEVDTRLKAVLNTKLQNDEKIKETGPHSFMQFTRYPLYGFDSPDKSPLNESQMRQAILAEGGQVPENVEGQQMNPNSKLLFWERQVAELYCTPINAKDRESFLIMFRRDFPNVSFFLKRSDLLVMNDEKKPHVKTWGGRKVPN